MPIDLAACYRLIAHYDMDDMFATHISARVPGREEHFLLNPLGVHYTQITASNLVRLILMGTLSATQITSSTRPDSSFIPPCTRRAPMRNTCSIRIRSLAWRWRAWRKDSCRLPRNRSVSTSASAITITRALPMTSEHSRLVASNALILRNHGLLTCGKTVAQAVMLMRHLEKSCQAQMAAMSTGDRLIKLSPNLMEHAEIPFEKQVDNRTGGWPSLLALLDGIDPRYRD